MTSLLLGLLCAAPYDPLLVQAAKVDVQDFVVDDAARRRPIPLRAFLPSTKRPAPVVLPQILTPNIMERTIKP